MIQSCAAYIHIPFCRRRCYYCDFPIAVIGDGGGKVDREQAMSHYVDQLCREIELTARWFPTSGLETVFFGGGTPSLLSVEGLHQILATVDQCFSIAKEAEISIEIDPGTFDLQQLQSYKNLGLNRYSLGVQCFDDDLLSQIGRTHRVVDINRSMDLFQQAGIENFSFDLISGLPNQTLSQWETTLEKAMAFSPPHLSCYDLIIEPGTVFERQEQIGKLSFPPDHLCAQMFRLTQQRLTDAGFTHYEISNYAQAGYQCRHNRVYWQNLPYYGWGMGATSYLDGKRYTRPRNRREYFLWLKGLTQDKNDLNLVSEIDSNEQLLETLMLGLRLQEGINLDSIEEQFGQLTVGKITQVVQPYLARNWVNLGKLDHSQCGQLRLTDPEGFLFSNTILADLFRAFILDS